MAFMLWVNGLISLALVWHHMRLAQRKGDAEAVGITLAP
jgi:uncharacterized membrane protein